MDDATTAVLLMAPSGSVDLHQSGIWSVETKGANQFSQTKTLSGKDYNWLGESWTPWLLVVAVLV